MPFYSKLPRFLREPLRNKSNKNIILDYYRNQPEASVSEEEREALRYLEKNDLSVFPYTFQEKYKKSDIQVYKDKKLGLKYIITEDKRLYFKRSSSVRGVKRNYRNLLIEQDPLSAHRYLTDDFNLSSNDILVDVGAAEGNLALEVIEKVKKVYLFETDVRWIEALEATFEPWKEKVEIVNKFVSDKNDESHISLDVFFKDKEAFTFLKVDAEGAEYQVLNGANAMFNQKTGMKIALCTYHRPNDNEFFNEYLLNKQFVVHNSEGFMIFTDQRAFTPPYLRRGLVKGKR